MNAIRIGHGYDVHRLVEGRTLVLGGIFIPYEKGLLGHSDADVLVHAVMDAVLGALALGDIGGFFPETSAAYKNSYSMVMLRECIKMMRSKRYALGNLDATIIAQKPKLAPYIPQMRESLATVFGCGIDCVNVKATTEEGLGFTGLGEGMSAHCVCILV